MLSGDLIFRMLLGHLVGDYIFQNNYMALNKKNKGWKGLLACFVHCAIYTITVIGFTVVDFINGDNPNLYMIYIVGIFLSHFIIDRSSIIENYFKLIKGRSWKRFSKIYNELPKSYINHSVELSAEITFISLVQTMADNTLHILMMYGLFVILI